MSEKLTHKDLVRRAEKWLRNTKGCSVVICESTAIGVEIPDAVGWKCAQSIQVECKTSRSDFLADRKKFTRHPAMAENGIGNHKYYLTPPGLLKPTDLPAGWGLLEVHGERIRKIREVGASQKNYHYEMLLLVAARKPPTCSEGSMTTTKPKTKTAVEWVLEFHAKTGGVWPTAGQVMEHCPTRMGLRTASRAIEKALQSKDGVNRAKSPLSPLHPSENAYN